MIKNRKTVNYQISHNARTQNYYNRNEIMKCPKCNYISFDHNQVCPSCNRDISSEQIKMNLPSFMPAPPSLLGALTGEAFDSGVGIQMGRSNELEAIEHEEDIGFGDSSELIIEEPVIDEVHDPDIDLRPQDLGEFEEMDPMEPEQEESEEFSIDLANISLDDIAPLDQDETKAPSNDEAEKVTLEMDGEQVKVFEDKKNGKENKSS